MGNEIPSEVRLALEVINKYFSSSVNQAASPANSLRKEEPVTEAMIRESALKMKSILGDNNTWLLDFVVGRMNQGKSFEQAKADAVAIFGVDPNKIPTPKQ